MPGSAEINDVHDKPSHKPEDPDLYQADEHKSTETSQWNDWKWDKNGVQHIGRMMIERLRKAMDSPTMYTYYKGQRMEAYNLSQDLAWAGVWHGDVGTNHIARRKPSVVCPRHAHAHSWRVIDLDRSYAVTAVDEERGLLAKAYYSIFQFPKFWVGDDTW
ncbi:hypothetical protein GLOTRDRAFT_126581 [Gloeophyllum trabeum ATCC 11539]|uniref:Uncharacterized protein n=1 Tax=Gloeophyllum trabeum (strain ATCC 11539 / FP-39264 / Madison 617) TaxID=670483 RepID=S7RTT5_GLOTA|nr:uncharacterized protein GLOTRDRAFT_126581 [Gloeophyllum trabeum ATCC 11539]EPQ58095.1 hypothetical protein GLOTRDRAFT_126581 [Gloeophyllum trabeum ATCC 11539]